MATEERVESSYNASAIIHIFNMLKKQVTSITAQCQNHITELTKLHHEKLSLTRGNNGNTILHWVLIIAACTISIFIGIGCH